MLRATSVPALQLLLAQPVGFGFLLSVILDVDHQSP